MGWILLQSDTGNEAGPNHKFQVVCQTWLTESGDNGYHIVRRYYIEVLPGHSSGTWCSTCKSSWNGANVALAAAGAYDISDIDCGWQAYGTTLDTPSFYAGYTSSSGNVYRSTGTISAYTVPQKPTSVPTWANTPGTNPNPYSTFTASDFSSYAYNGTLYGSGSYDSMRSDNTKRILLAYAIQVSYGDIISLTGVTDISVEGSTVSGSGADIYVAVMEYDAAGQCLLDANWIQADCNWVAGQSNEGTVYGNRGTVRWLVYLFRNGANSDITAQQVLNTMGSTIYFSRPFTYTVSGNGGLVEGSDSVKYYRCDTRTELRDTAANTSYTTKSFADPVRPGYRFSGWKIAPAHRTAPSGLFTSAALNNAVSSGKYYSYLFDDVTFTAQWEVANVAYIRQNGIYVPCNTYVKKDGCWCPAIPYVKKDGAYKRSTV